MKLSPTSMIFNTIYDGSKPGSGYKRDSVSLSDEGDSRSSDPILQQQTQLIAYDAGANDGASIEVVKKPRGRPPGSKNKPKPPVIITREADPSTAMRTHVLEIPAGQDVADCLMSYARRRRVGLCVVGATGAVGNVTFRQPEAGSGGGGGGGGGAAGGTVGFRGRFDILSISATFMQGTSAAVWDGNLSVSLAGPQGQVVGGVVAGPLVAATTVVVVAAVFTNPTFHRLPVEEDGSGDGDGGAKPENVSDDRIVYQQQEQPQPQPQHGRPHYRQGLAAPPVVTESRGMAMYGCHVPTDVLWAPTARPPPPPY